jgi:molybdenum cofactor guanylyltransferase
VIEALVPQISRILINANRNRMTYATYGYPVITDEFDGFQGPLAGFVSAMAAVTTPWITTLPCDGPFPAPDLVERLCAALAGQDAEIAVATDGNRVQPVYALLPVALAPSLREFLASGERKIDRWYARHQVALADLGDRPKGFININTAADSQRLERELKT